VGSIQASQVKAKLIQEGRVAQVSITFKKRSELMNPEHCLVQFGDCNCNNRHPLYVALKQVHHFHGEATEEEVCVLHVYLPFRRDPHGFYDPINMEQDVIDLGIFPLPNILDYDTPRHAAAPSTKFLHLMCEELAKSKLDQKIPGTLILQKARHGKKSRIPRYLSNS
jgi:hypothetical protein